MFRRTGDSEVPQSTQQNSEGQGSVVLRMAQLPLFSSMLQMVNAAYTGAKGRYTLVGLMGGVAEVSVRNVSAAAAHRAAPLMQRLEPQIKVANTYACAGLDQLERSIPILNQSVEEVMGHLKDAFFLTLDDVQIRVNEELDRILDRTERLVEGTRSTFGASLGIIRDSSLGVALVSGFDNLLTRSEEAVNYFLPLPPTLQRELELRIQGYEDEDEGEEPGIWTRIRSLLLCVALYLYHRALLLKASLQHALRTLGDLSDLVGITQVLEALILLYQRLLAFSIAQVNQLVALMNLVVTQLSEVTRMILALRPVSLALSLPSVARENLMVLISDLQELSKILLQLLINTTPLYNMLQQPSEQQLEDYLSQEDLSENSSRRGSGNSLFLKVQDGRARRRRSLYGRSRRGSSSASAPAAIVATPANGRRGSMRQDSLELDTLAVPSANMIHRRSSATEVLLAPIMQLVSQGQRAFEYLSPAPHQEDRPIPVVETTDH